MTFDAKFWSTSLKYFRREYETSTLRGIIKFIENSRSNLKLTRVIDYN